MTSNKKLVTIIREAMTEEWQTMDEIIKTIGSGFKRDIVSNSVQVLVKKGEFERESEIHCRPQRFRVASPPNAPAPKFVKNCMCDKYTNCTDCQSNDATIAKAERERVLKLALDLINHEGFLDIAYDDPIILIPDVERCFNAIRIVDDNSLRSTKEP